MKTIDKKDASRMAQLLRYCASCRDESPRRKRKFNSTDRLSDLCVHQLFRESADIIESLLARLDKAERRLDKAERAYNILLDDFTSNVDMCAKLSNSLLDTESILQRIRSL